MSTNKQQTGFTLVEMLVVAPIVILAVGAFLSILVTMTGEVIASRAANTLTYNTQDALRQIEQDVKQSAGFLAVNNIALDSGGASSEATTNSRQGFNSDATAFTNVGANGPMLILNMVATTDNPNSLTSQYVRLVNQPNPCNTGQGNSVLTYNIVYFIKDSSLWRRTVMPSSYTDTAYRCETPWQQPSCTPSYMSGRTGVFCKTEDVRLIDGVVASDFILEYFTGSASTTANAVATNGGATAAARQSALQSSTTVKASVTARQNAGGRQVTHANSIRASRLDNNSSGIATPIATTTPAAPVVTVQPKTAAGINIQWPAVGGARTYSVDYQVDGGAWNTLQSNQNVRSLSVENLYNGASVAVRVTASNSAGTSTYGVGTTNIPVWEPLLMRNGWVNHGASYAPPSYTKTRSGLVLLKGVIRKSNGAPVSGQSVAKLPYWPSTTTAQPTFSDLQAARVQVYGAENPSRQGEIAFSGNISNNWTSLDTIRFIPTASGLVQTTVAPFNGWGQTSSPLKYAVDGSGRVAAQGILTVGTLDTNARFAIFPAELNPGQRLMSPTIAGTSFGSVAIDHRPSVGTFQPRQTPSSPPDMGIQHLYYPNTYSGWTEATLLNGWVNYGSVQSTAGYTKSAHDNVVSLKGTIRSGTTTAHTPLINLPVGSRPKELLNFIVVSDMGFGSIEIAPDGNVRFRNGSGLMMSMDNISFKAEQ